MRRFVFILLLGSTFMLTFCNPSSDPKSESQEMPAHAAAIQVDISNLNCWKERGNFYVTGICSNPTDQWQKIWLRMEASDSTGEARYFNGAPGVVFPVFSAAVPPRGRSAFFQGWPLKFFSKLPDTCRVSGAGALVKEAGPVLLVEELSGVRMLAPLSPGSDSSANMERGWQISANLSNPLEMTARHPRLEILIYGKDNRLWFANVLNPEDRALSKVLEMEGSGPLKPGSKRRFGTQISYGNLPQQLNTKKIGRIEMLAFEER